MGFTSHRGFESRPLRSLRSAQRRHSEGRYARSSQAPVAQLDRASVYGTEGHRFESCRARQKALPLTLSSTDVELCPHSVPRAPQPRDSLGGVRRLEPPTGHVFRRDGKRRLSAVAQSGQRLLADLTAAHEPFVIGFDGEHRDQPDQRDVVGDNPDDVGVAGDPAVEGAQAGWSSGSSAGARSAKGRSPARRSRRPRATRRPSPGGAHSPALKRSQSAQRRLKAVADRRVGTEAFVMA